MPAPTRPAATTNEITIAGTKISGGTIGCTRESASSRRFSNIGGDAASISERVRDEDSMGLREFKASGGPNVKSPGREVVGMTRWAPRPGAADQRFSITARTLPAGSLNQAISGPPPRKIPRASVSISVPA